MKAAVFLLVSIIILAGGVALVVAAAVLPYVKSPQTMTSNGPVYSYGNGTVQISGYYFPPIDRGTQIVLDVTGYKPDSITISFFPSASSSVSPTGSPLLFQPNLGDSKFHAILTSTDTQPYGMYVNSLNRSSFTVQVHSVWSPYQYLVGYVPEGFFLMLLGAIGVAYSRGAKRRQDEYKRVVAEVQARKSQPSGGSAASG
jgi:hypothetical protein